MLQLTWLPPIKSDVRKVIEEYELCLSLGYDKETAMEYALLKLVHS